MKNCYFLVPLQPRKARFIPCNYIIDMKDYFLFSRINCKIFRQCKFQEIKRNLHLKLHKCLRWKPVIMGSSCNLTTFSQNGGARGSLHDANSVMTQEMSN